MDFEPLARLEVRGRRDLRTSKLYGSDQPFVRATLAWQLAGEV